jgi:hypothetical protein
VSDLQEECKNCGEPIELDTCTVYMNYDPSQDRWVHVKYHVAVCYPQNSNSTSAEKCEHDWYETETGCEDCGTHPAVRCPECGMVIDTVMNSDPRNEEDE